MEPVLSLNEAALIGAFMAATLVLLAACAGISCYALHRALNAVIAVEALKNSTHQIQYEPVEFPEANDEGPTEAQEKNISAQMAKADREAMARLGVEEEEPLD